MANLVAKSSTLRSCDVTDYVPGNWIGEKYRLERLIDEGAQGSIWLAENVALGASVAIKLVHSEGANAAPTLRLEKEARAAAQIAHPAVVRVFDLGRTPTGDAFTVMEFLEGENLAEILAARGRLSAVETVRTLLPIAEVLEVAHERGIVHRDLKPENVFLSKSGGSIQPKLLDFGIAKLTEPKRGDRVITQVGMLVGSPAYVSPEQAVCRDDVGKEADVWSFCVVLYECLTGTLPFASDSYRELFRKIGEDAPESILAHGVGDFELWEIVRRGLAKVPSERWSSMQALGRALAQWLETQGVQEDISGVVLASKWLGRNRSDPVPFDPPSLVRHVANDETQAAWRASEAARPVPSRWRYVALVAVAAAATAVFVDRRWWTQAQEMDIGVLVPFVAKSPPESRAPLEQLPATPTAEPTLTAEPTSPAAQPPAAHEATAQATAATTLSRSTVEPSKPAPPAVVQRPAVTARDAGVPAKRIIRREPDSDLLNPY
jgi:eukaryotic-like serine/threonine-protein kinase